MKEMNMPTDWGTVYYWIPDVWEENRDTIFFLHGLTANHTMFEQQYEFFGGKYNLVTWDAPAHGKSRPFDEFTYEKAASIAKEILGYCKVSDAIFVGQSMGGFITQSVIKRFPDIVKAFVSIDSTPFGEEYYSTSDKWWLRQIEWMSHLYPAKTIKKAIAKQVATTEAAYQNMMDMLSDYSKNELCHLMGIGYVGFLDDNCNLDIKCPVMLLLGENDKTGKVKKYNQEWSKRAGYPLVIIKGAAHNSNVDQPNAVNQEISKFIASL